MIRTRITEMLGIRHPIIGGTMMWISDADFAAAIQDSCIILLRRRLCIGRPGKSMEEA